MKVYVVTSGEYSSYGIVGVCKTRDAALSFLKKRNEEQRQDTIGSLKYNEDHKEELIERWGIESYQGNLDYLNEKLRDWDPNVKSGPYGGESSYIIDGNHYYIEEYDLYE